MNVVTRGSIKMKNLLAFIIVSLVQCGNAFVFSMESRSGGLKTPVNHHACGDISRPPDRTSVSRLMVAKKDNAEEKLEYVRKSVMIEAIAERANLSKADAEAALVAFVEVVVDSVSDGKKVNLQGFGTFEPRGRAGRTGRNPRTGESMEIKATTVPAFVASKTFKDQVKAAHE